MIFNLYLLDTTMQKKELVFIGVKVPKLLKNRIDAAVNRGDYATQSELFRVALRQLFEKEVS